MNETRKKCEDCGREFYSRSNRVRCEPCAHKRKMKRVREYARKRYDLKRKERLSHERET